MTVSPPYKIIKGLINRGECVPFIGAGVNVGLRKSSQERWNESVTTFLPTGSELSLWNRRARGRSLPGRKRLGRRRVSRPPSCN